MIISFKIEKKQEKRDVNMIGTEVVKKTKAILIFFCIASLDLSFYDEINICYDFGL
jgi:hypothetical protein